MMLILCRVKMFLCIIQTLSWKKSTQIHQKDEIEKDDGIDEVPGSALTNALHVIASVVLPPRSIQFDQVMFYF